MPDQAEQVLRLRFTGGIYESQMLDGPAMREVLKVMSALAETAYSLWRSRNPRRQRVPRGFGSALQLGIRDISNGSTSPALVRINQPLEPHLFDDDLANAAAYMYSVFAGSGGAEPLPDHLDEGLCLLYSKLGTSIAAPCGMGISRNGSDTAFVSATARQSLLDRLPSLRRSIVDLSGRVLAADVHRQRFQLWLDHSQYVEAPFTRDQERQITEALSAHESMRVSIRGEGYVRRDGNIESLESVDQVDLIGGLQTEYDPTAPTIDELVTNAFVDVPREDWTALPIDLSERHDHYLSGDRRRSS